MSSEIDSDNDILNTSTRKRRNKNRRRMKIKRKRVLFYRRIRHGKPPPKRRSYAFSIQKRKKKPVEMPKPILHELYHYHSRVPEFHTPEHGVVPYSPFLEVIAHSIFNQSPLSELHMAEEQIHGKHVEALDLVFRRGLGPQVLFLSKRIDTDTFQSLAKVIEGSKLQELYMPNKHIDVRVADALTEMLQAPQLHILYLSNNKMDYTSLSALAESLKTNTVLQQLYLCQNSLDCDSAIIFANLLECNSTLKRLSLIFNKIGCEGAASLAQALKHNSTLEMLDLSCNKIDSPGITALAEALGENSSLKRLDIASNRCDSRGAASLAQALKCNTTLQELNLSNNQLDSNAALHLEEALQCNSTLRVLNLSNNHIQNLNIEGLSSNLKVLVKKWAFPSQKSTNGGGGAAATVKSKTRADRFSSTLSTSKKQKISNSVNQLIPLYQKWNTLKARNAPPASDENLIASISRNLQDLCALLNAKFSKEELMRIEECSPTDSLTRQLSFFFSFEKTFREWMQNHGECNVHAQLLKQSKAVLIDLEDDCEEIEFKLKRDLKKHRLSPAQKKKAEKRIENCKMEISSLNHEIESLMRKLSAYPKMVHETYLRTVEMVLMKDSMCENEPAAEMERKLIQHGKLLQRDFNSDYDNRVSLDRAQTVVKAQSKRAYNQEVILKKLCFSEASHQTMAWNELNHLLKLQNRPFVVELNGAFIQESPYGSDLILEMPFYSNGNLMHWLKKQEYETSVPNYNAMEIRKAKTQRSEHEIILMFLQIAEAVGEIHSLGVEHRDLKPENILLEGKGSLVRVKLIDFGIGKDSNISFSTTMKTASGVHVQMTTRYAPPERKYAYSSTSGENVHIADSWDMYSLGVILYEMLCAPEDACKLDFLSDTNIDASEALLAHSGMLSEWSFDLVKALLSIKPHDRPSASEVCQSLKQRVFDSHSEMLTRIERRRDSARPQLRKSVQSSFKLNTRGEQLKIRRSHLLDDTFRCFSKFKTRHDLLRNHMVQYADESGHGSGVFRDLCTLLVEQLQGGAAGTSILQRTSSEEWEFFSPLDQKKENKRMFSLGRFLFYCVARNYTLHLRLSPLVYCTLVDQVPTTANGWLNILRPYDSFVSHIESYLQSKRNSTEDREMAIEQIEAKKRHLQGSQHRMSNIKRFCKGFTSCMTAYEKEKLHQLSWRDAQLLCAGNEVISSGTILQVMNQSLKRQCWKEHERTVNWLREWIRDQDSDGLRLFLGFCTGLNTLPIDLKEFNIRVKPCAEYVHAATCFKQIRIGTGCKSREEFFSMMNQVMENYTVEGQRQLED